MRFLQYEVRSAIVENRLTHGRYSRTALRIAPPSHDRSRPVRPTKLSASSSSVYPHIRVKWIDPWTTVRALITKARVGFLRRAAIASRTRVLTAGEALTTLAQR
jgi:hypothetical protein